MRLDHAIFTTPLQPRIETHEIETPKGYANWESGQPAKLAAWTVQEGELGQSVDYGLVSNPYGFEDSPDAEWISGGVNSKGPRSTAIGRQGNWFLWGFAGDPTQMTESARQVFLNSIVWMKAFDGRKPMLELGTASVRADQGAVIAVDESIRRAPARDESLVHVNFLRSYGKNLSGVSWVRQQFPKSLWASTNGDPDTLERHFRDHFEWLRAVPTEVEYENEDGKKTTSTYQGFVIDADPILAELMVSNRKPEFFAAFTKLLHERGADDATVRRLAADYLPRDVPLDSSAAFETWLAKSRDRLFFSDVYGYRWFVAPESWRVPAKPARATSGSGGS